jgi:hypothetical protein
MMHPVARIWQTLRAALFSPGPRRSQRPRRVALGLEAFEDRMVPTVLTVLSAADGLGPGTLRSAIAQANFDADNGISDRIVFDQSAGSTIRLRQGELPLSGNPFVTITIDGGNHVTIDGMSNGRIFNVAPGTNAVLTGLLLTNGNAGDENGGAIMNRGTLTLDNDDITGNVATSGGGIANLDHGALTVTNSYIAGNTATMFAGGIATDAKASLNVANSTIVVANTQGLGGSQIDTPQPLDGESGFVPDPPTSPSPAPPTSVTTQPTGPDGGALQDVLNPSGPVP